MPAVTGTPAIAGTPAITGRPATVTTSGSKGTLAIAGMPTAAEMQAIAVPVSQARAVMPA